MKKNDVFTFAAPNGVEVTGVCLDLIRNTYKSGVWPGNLNLIIKKLDFNVDNRAIPEELGERRMTCGQRCWSGSGCHLCVSAFRFADQIRKEHLRRNQKADIDNN